MAINVIKAERVVATMLGLLERESVVSRLLWLNPGGDFRGAKNDTISIRVPAYAVSRTRDLRSGDPRVASSLTETKIDVSLTTDVYMRVPITDEELTLDIESFDQQITQPVASAIVRGVEDAALSRLSTTTYQHNVNIDDFARPFDAVVRARRHLNDSRVPQDGRVVVVGSEVEEILLTDDLFVRADQSGSTNALREAEIGRIAGMPVYTAPGLDPQEAYAFHRTAFALLTRAPMVPRGAPWGTTMAWGGFSLRVVQAIDPEEVVDNFHADLWLGTGIVRDFGSLDADGFFAPDPDPNMDTDTPLFVRAVRLTTGGS
jgi:P22 coat protein - gene protein 5